MSARRIRLLRKSYTVFLATLLIIEFANQRVVARADETGRLEMWEEPSHQLVFVDGPARILDVRIVPGVTSEFHKHRFATTYVVIQDALVANQFWEGEWSASGPRDYRNPGASVDQSGYVDKPTYHRVRNEDQRLFHLVAVINERAATSLATTNKDAGEDGTIDNKWFSEHRIQVARGSSSGELEFSSDVALIQPGAGSSYVLENGVAHSFKSAPAAFSWHRSGSRFQIANNGAENLEFVLIEVKE